METYKSKIIAIHPENGFLVEDVYLSSADEEIEEHDSFNSYVHYEIHSIIDSYEQIGYAAINVREHELADIIEELKKVS